MKVSQNTFNIKSFQNQLNSGAIIYYSKDTNVMQQSDHLTNIPGYI